MEGFKVGDRRQRHLGIQAPGDTPGIRHRSAQRKQRRKARLGQCLAGQMGHSGFEAAHGKIIVGLGLRMPPAQGRRCPVKTPQVVGHIRLHTEIHAQVLAKIEYQLKTQRVIPEAGKQRCPGHCT